MAGDGLALREGTVQDMAALTEILNHYITNTVSLWLYDTVTVEQKETWFQQTFLQCPTEEGITCPPNYFVSCVDENDYLLGYAYYTPYRARAGWRFTKETSIYVRPGHSGKGIGSLLYQKLIEKAREQKLRGLMGIVGGDNKASMALHRRSGFVYVGALSNVGEKSGQNLDAHYFHLDLTQ